jgi:hypothetical protein
VADARRKLDVVEGLPFPPDAVTQTFGFIARKGHGKTYAAGRLVEELLGSRAPVVVLDPVGTWYGLRLARDGKSPGLEVPVFGGDHGDIPITPSAGPTLARAIVEHNTSAVVDVSGFRKGEMKTFVAAFCEELFQRAKRDRRPRMVVFEEAQVFAPQRTTPESARMLGAVEDIVRLGRNCGLGSALISQRPQSVNKEVLNQVECLFVGQLNAAHERKAIDEWILEKGVKLDASDLPSLPVGTMYLWSPGWLRTFQKVRVLPKQTFDASATPELGAARHDVELRPVDLEALRTALAAEVEAAEGSDPKKLGALAQRLRDEVDSLHARISTLEEELAAARARAASVDTEKVVAAARGLFGPIREAVQSALDTMESTEFQATLSDFAAVAKTAVRTAHEGFPVQNVAPRRFTPPAAPAKPTPRPTRARGPVDTAFLAKGERIVLTAIAQYPEGVDHVQLAVLTGYKKTSRETYVGKLRASGLVVSERGQIRATEDGLASLGDDFEALPTGAKLLEHWRERLPEGERRVLDAIVGGYPSGVSYTEIERSTGYRKTSRETYVGKLRARRLITTDGGIATASSLLFGKGGRR